MMSLTDFKRVKPMLIKMRELYDKHGYSDTYAEMLNMFAKYDTELIHRIIMLLW